MSPLELFQYSVTITLAGLSRLPHLTLLQHHILALSLTALTTLGLGLLVFFAEPRRRLNQIFGLYSLAITGWAVNEIFVLPAPDQSTANLWAYVIGWPCIIFLAPTFLHSILLSIREKSKVTWRILKIAYTLSFVFLGLHFFLPGVLTESPKPSSGYEYFRQDISTLGLLIPLTFLVLVNLALWKLWRSYRRATGQRRTQLKFLFWASVAGYLGGSPDWFLVFKIHVPFLNPFGLYGVPCYSVAMTYAVLYHRLFNVNLVFRKSLIYSLLVTSMTIGYFSLVHFIERIFQTTFGYHSVGLSLTAFALMALTFQPLKVGIQRLVDHLLFRAPREELVKKVERLEEEVRETERLKAVSILAAGLAHEIKNPLASIKTFTEYLGSRYDEPEFRAKFQKIVGGEVERINLIVQQLLNFAKPAPSRLVPLDVPKLLDETLELLNSEVVHRHVQIHKRYKGDEQVLGDPQQLKQAFINLILNSLQAMNGDARLELRTAVDGPNLLVTIADNGCGIAPKDLPRIFEPFYTTKPTGTGLGLAVVQGIVHEHGGRIWAESQLGQGTRLTLHLPIAT